MMARLRVLIVAAALALAGAACSSDAGTGGAATGPGASSPNTFEYAVGQRGIELVDASRPTAAEPNRNLPERPNRTIPVTVSGSGRAETKPDTCRGRPGRRRKVCAGTAIRPLSALATRGASVATTKHGRVGHR
jgi:hypothetical protein